MNNPEGSEADKWSPFEILQFRVAEIHWRGKVWKQLFAGVRENEEDVEDRISLMNRSAEAFFTIVQQMLLDDIIARICKLLDPAEQGPQKRENLSLLSALERARDRIDNDAQAKAIELIDEFKRKSEPLIRRRNWRISHDDFLVATGTEKPPEFVLDESMDGALRSAEAIMNIFDPRFREVEYRYADMIAQGDGRAILRALRQADQYRKACRALNCRPLV